MKNDIVRSLLRSVGACCAVWVVGMTGCGNDLDAAAAGATATRRPTSAGDGPSGADVSGYDPGVDWGSVANTQSFVYIKATEGTYYRNPYFADQYDGSYDAGMIRGSYHFARPDTTSGKTQADYFLKHGGGWSGDGQTLPGALDIEYNPYGDECYDLSPGDMVAWVHSFADEYLAKTGVNAVIYSTADWWNTCTGSSTDFGATNALWIADYDNGAPAIAAGWSGYTFWQYTSTGSVAGISGDVDVNVFNGASSDLANFATNPP